MKYLLLKNIIAQQMERQNEECLRMSCPVCKFKSPVKFNDMLNRWYITKGRWRNKVLDKIPQRLRYILRLYNKYKTIEVDVCPVCNNKLPVSEWRLVSFPSIINQIKRGSHAMSEP